MRLFLLLATALVAALNGEVFDLKLANGFPDGTIVTLFFWHDNYGSSDADVIVNFYDSYPDGKPVHDYVNFRLRNEYETPVTSKTAVNGKWQKETTNKQPYDGFAPYVGYWQFDVVKLDSRRMNVFFRGIWSGSHTFAKSLDNIKYVEIAGGFVNFGHIEIAVNLPNANIVPLSHTEFLDFLEEDNFKVSRTLTTVPNFPIGTQLKIVALLRSSAGDAYMRNPTLFFVPTGIKANAYLMKIFQHWESLNFWYHKYAWSLKAVYSHMLYIEEFGRKEGDHRSCTSFYTIPNGDLVHFLLTRKSKVMVVLTALYKTPQTDHSFSPTVIECEIVVPEAYADQMDRPFEIVSGDGALIFHLEKTIDYKYPKINWA